MQNTWPIIAAHDAQARVVRSYRLLRMLEAPEEGSEEEGEESRLRAELEEESRLKNKKQAAELRAEAGQARRAELLSEQLAELACEAEAAEGDAAPAPRVAAAAGAEPAAAEAEPDFGDFLREMDAAQQATGAAAAAERDAAEAEAAEASARVQRAFAGGSRASQLWNEASEILVEAREASNRAQEELPGAEAGESPLLRNELQAQREEIHDMVQRMADYDAATPEMHEVAEQVPEMGSEMGASSSRVPEVVLPRWPEEPWPQQHRAHLVVQQRFVVHESLVVVAGAQPCERLLVLGACEARGTPAGAAYAHDRPQMPQRPPPRPQSPRPPRPGPPLAATSASTPSSAGAARTTTVGRGRRAAAGRPSAPCRCM